jgi:(E)-4-hydroxy-3-methylbut-2-enyl-diphosphate synthase
MGCIVNGPGEMADADFGYVGGAPRKGESLRWQNACEIHISEGEEVVD